MLSRSRHIPFTSSGNWATKAIRIPQLAVLLSLLLVSIHAKAFVGFRQGRASGILSNSIQPNLQSPNASHVAAVFPFQSVPTGLEIELLEEAEVEDDLNEYWTHIVSAINADEHGFSNAVLSRLLQQHAALHNRQTVPYFILYHSWKSYLA